MTRGLETIQLEMAAANAAGKLRYPGAFGFWVPFAISTDFRATLQGMNSPFPWPRGKCALLKTLIASIAPHENYVEVFAGSAKLLFAKEPSRFEIINDLNGDVTNYPAHIHDRVIAVF